MTGARRVRIGDTALEVADRGSGDPIVFVQTALTADEFRPVADDAALRSGFRKVLYHRRGYGSSDGAEVPGSIGLDASDCRALLAALDIERAHLLGGSYSAAVALRLAIDAPEVVHSLTLLEPPPTNTSSADEFRAATERVLRVRREFGPEEALAEFFTMIGWDRDAAERLLPGSVAQMERDAVTFFDVDMPALLDWRFDAADAARVTCPVLHVGGAESGPLFAEVRRLVLDWFPDADDVVIPGAGHGMAVTHPRQVASVVAAFLRAHPM